MIPTSRAGPEREVEASRIRRVLIVRLSALGDCVHALPVVEALRRWSGEVEVGWAIQEQGAAVVSAFGAVSRLHLYPRRGSVWQRLSRLASLRRELRAQRYDVAIDLQGNSKSGLVMWLSGARRNIGLPPGDRRELNRLLVPMAPSAPVRGGEAGGSGAPTTHVVERTLALLRPLGVPARPAPRPSLRGDLPSGPMARGVVICPGTTWPTKHWPRRHYAALAAALAAGGRRVELFWGGEAERRLAEQVRDEARASTGLGAAGAAIELSPELELAQLPGYFAAASSVVGNDSGPLHLAAVLGRPAVALYGPTDPGRNGLFWSNTSSLTLLDAAAGELECRPCWSRRCARGDLACLERLEVSAVLEALTRLERRGGQAGDEADTSEA
ncbi:MAG: lipopolysaccharide heptosyltransferase family protein [Acidobacteria bacterium]|nr:MAG: lipopolysaccharide heptosyltransferase family protein [Acidobacteriota bacterium]